MIRHLQRQTVTLSRSNGKDRYGKETFTAGESVKSRFNEKTTNIFKPNGEVIIVLANCYLPPDTTVNIDDKVTYLGVDYKVYTKKVVRDDRANTHHIKVQLTKWQ